MATLSDAIRSIGARGGPAGGVTNALQARAGLANQAAAPTAQSLLQRYGYGTPAYGGGAPQMSQPEAIGSLARQMGPASAMGGMMGGAGSAVGPSAWGQMAQQAGGMMGGPGYDQMAQRQAGIGGGGMPDYNQMAQQQAGVLGGGPSWGGQPDYSRLATQMNSLMPNVTNLMRR